MLRGPDQIIACPRCKGLAKYATLMSGNTGGALLWTDGKQVAPMLPCPPAVVKCRHCAECYWLADAEEIGTVERSRGEDQQVNPAWSAAQEVEEPTEEEYYLALERNLAKDRQQERRLRVLALWRHNDALRFRARCVSAASEAWRQNLAALARLLDEADENDRIMKAEVLREFGQFELAKEVLSRVSSSKHRSVVRQLRDLCKRGDSCVRRLSFEESQDVGALIEIVKTTGDLATALRALDALGEIGNWADSAFLVELLKDERDMIRGMAAKLLFELGPHAKRAIPALRRALADESCYVRMYAKRALQSLDRL